jgi:hypothetical protein
MAERLLTRIVGIVNASSEVDNIMNVQGIAKADINIQPLDRERLLVYFWNDIPVVTLADGATTTYEYGSEVPTWSDLVDVTDGDHSTGFTITADTTNLDMDTIGTYTVPVIATDSAGNTSDELEIEITIEDTTIPVISDAETLETTYVTGSTEPDWTTGITATDGYDGDITDDIVVGDSAVDMTTVGTFDVTYDVDDSSGNSATQVSKTITITAE